MSNSIPQGTEDSPKRNEPLPTAHDLSREERAPTWLGPSYSGPAFSLAFDVQETKDCFVFKAVLPGVKDKDVEVKLTGTHLEISGHREAEHQERTDTYYAYERTYGTFLRTFFLPEDIDHDHVSTEMKEGVLMVVVPRKATTTTRTQWPR